MVGCNGRFVIWSDSGPVVIVSFSGLFSSDGEAWADRWVHSTAKGSEGAKFKLTAGKFYGDAEKDQGMQEFADTFLF